MKKSTPDAPDTTPSSERPPGVPADAVFIPGEMPSPRDWLNGADFKPFPTIEDHAQALAVEPWWMAAVFTQEKWGEGHRCSRAEFEAVLASVKAAPIGANDAPARLSK